MAYHKPVRIPLNRPTDTLSPNGGYVFTVRPKNWHGARDLSRRNAGPADPRWEIGMPFRQPTFLRTKVRAPIAVPGEAVNTYNGGEGQGEGVRFIESSFRSAHALGPRTSSSCSFSSSSSKSSHPIEDEDENGNEDERKVSGKRSWCPVRVGGKSGRRAEPIIIESDGASDLTIQHAEWIEHDSPRHDCANHFHIHLPEFGPGRRDDQRVSLAATFDRAAALFELRVGINRQFHRRIIRLFAAFGNAREEGDCRGVFDRVRVLLVSKAPNGHRRGIGTDSAFLKGALERARQRAFQKRGV